MSPRSWPSQDPSLSGWVAFVVAAFLAFGSAGMIAALMLWALRIQWHPASPLVAMAGLAALTLSGLSWLLGGVPDVDILHVAPARPVASLLAVIGVLAVLVAVWGDRDGATTPDLRVQVGHVGAAVRHLLTPVERPGRMPETALMRSVAILVVVWLHALPTEFGAIGLPGDRWVADVAGFAVPTLVFVAGYLVGRHAPAPGWTRRRLEHLLLPYLVASAVAIGLRWWSDAFPPLDAPLLDLATGATFGPYYLVLVLVALTLVTLPLRRLEGRLAGVVLGLAVVAQVAVEVMGDSLFWRVRNPLLWLAFYLAGMVVSRHRARLAAHAPMWPTVLLGWSVLATVLLAVPDASAARGVLTIAAAWMMIAVLWLAGCASRRRPPVAWWLDRTAYPLYLFHVPFVLVVAGPFGTSAMALGSLAGGAVGLIGAASALVVGRHVLGTASPRLRGT